MSILDNNQSSIDKSIQISNNIKNTTRFTFQSMVNAFNNGSQTFWNNPRVSPTELAKALGSDAKEIFELHYALGQLINNIKPEAIARGWSVIGQFTMNDDGTVTIIIPTPTPTVTTTPTPTPTPTIVPVPSSTPEPISDSEDL